MFISFITLPFLDRDPKAIEIVQVILESVLLRREKNMRDSDGKKIVELPAKEVMCTLWYEGTHPHCPPLGESGKPRIFAIGEEDIRLDIH
jgi:hypothetical protein